MGLKLLVFISFIIGLILLSRGIGDRKLSWNLSLFKLSLFFCESDDDGMGDKSPLLILFFPKVINISSFWILLLFCWLFWLFKLLLLFFRNIAKSSNIFWKLLGDKIGFSKICFVNVGSYFFIS